MELSITAVHTIFQKFIGTRPMSPFNCWTLVQQFYAHLNLPMLPCNDYFLSVTSPMPGDVVACLEQGCVTHVGLAHGHYYMVEYVKDIGSVLLVPMEKHPERLLYRHKNLIINGLD